MLRFTGVAIVDFVNDKKFSKFSVEIYEGIKISITKRFAVTVSKINLLGGSKVFRFWQMELEQL